ncbi:MAG TPA: FAD-dependent oxidoreductase [Candidatus Binataceae bacterium]|nr:FAD-dependent oxidoreductase [Candidatus Binataceae bacterium]
MNRRAFLKAIGSAALLPMLPRRLFADSASVASGFRRRRPSDANWPSEADWKRLNDSVGGNLIRVDSPLSVFTTDPNGDAAKALAVNLKNPYYVGEQLGLTESSGWLDAWASKPSVYAVAARNANDIAAGVNFARDNNLRLVVKGGGHSYQGNSNAPDSLLIWTRHMNDIAMHDAFVPSGCEHAMQPQPAVTFGTGVIGRYAYDAVTTKAGKYIQGGGCLTVGLSGLIQGGGFGSYSKRYGTAAGSLLEAEVVTADGQVRIANACTNPDLFWALKGGGGGTFGIVSKMTVRAHELPDYFGAANITIKASSDDAYRGLIRDFFAFYRDQLFNEHWGEQVHVRPDNVLEVQMCSAGLSSEQARQVWQPFLDAVKQSSQLSITGTTAIGSIPARHWWDPPYWKEHWPEIAFPRDGTMHAILDDVLLRVMHQPVLTFDPRPGASPDNVWWVGNTGECSIFWWGYQSLWLPQSLLEADSQQRLADALFAASRHASIELHFNKGLAGAPPDAIEAAKNTCTNPALLNAFALAIFADGQPPAYPGIAGHEPSVDDGHKAAARLDLCMNELRKVAPDGGAYVSESNYFEKNFQQSYWGANYPRLLEIKKKYDPNGLFFVHNGVGSEEWSRDGFTKL